MPTLQPVRCPGAGVFQKEGQEDAVEDVEEMVLEVHHGRCAVVKMAGNVLFGRGLSVSKEGTSEGAGAVCHPHQGRDTLKGWQPVWATCARAGTPLID